MVPIISENLHVVRIETKQYMQRSMGILKKNVTSYLILATDNILYMSKSEEPLNELLKILDTSLLSKSRKDLNHNS